jgi:hydroxyquinol 1,2-dioxygenase
VLETLVRLGDDADQRRQQLIMLSDTLGVSMLLDALANPKPPEATESTVLGPFHVPGAPLREFGEPIVGRRAGIPAWVYGTVASTSGTPIAGAELDVWQNGEDGLYAVQDREGPEDHLRGRFRTREDGSYAFIGVRPTPYQIPTDGQVGRMLRATARLPWRPAHIHMIVTAAGYEPLTTHMFDADSPYLDSDPVFAVKPSLLRKFESRSPADPERPAGISGEWCSVRKLAPWARSARARPAPRPPPAPVIATVLPGGSSLTGSAPG